MSGPELKAVRALVYPSSFAAKRFAGFSRRVGEPLQSLKIAHSFIGRQSQILSQQRAVNSCLVSLDDGVRRFGCNDRE